LVGASLANERVFFITNRKVDSETPGKATFLDEHNKWPEQLRVGEATVAFPAGYYADDPPPPSSVTVYPENMKVDPPLLGSKRLFEELLKIVNAGNIDVLFYVHGYDTTFEESLTFSAEIQHNLNAVRATVIGKNKALDATIPRVQIVVFSWPSQGRLVPYLSYFDDRTEAKQSAIPLSRALQKLRDKLDSLHADRVVNLPVNAAASTIGGRRGVFDEGAVCEFKVHLMAQSMGVYVLRHAIQDLRTRTGFRPRFPQVFDQVFMTGADEDRDAFDCVDKLAPLPDLARQVTLYLNHKDRALLISASTKHLAGRLGREGPERDVTLTKVSTVDVSPVLPAQTNDWVHHYYGRLNPIVQADVLYAMSDRTVDQVPGRVLVTQPRQFRLEMPKRTRLRAA
jgi:esterase/lipase superfamily enzyme